MNRVALGLVVALLLSACSFGEGSEPGGENDAEAFKTTMDALAQKLLPALSQELGGAPLNGMQARFYEKGGGFGVWAYTADGVFEGPFDAALDPLAAGRSVLEAQGLEISDDDATGLEGRADGILVVLDAVPAPAGDGVARLSITMVSDVGLSSRDDFAQDAPDEDYSALVG